MTPSAFIYINANGREFLEYDEIEDDALMRGATKIPLYTAHEIAKFVVTLSHDIVGKPATTEQLVVEATYLDIADRIEQERKKDF